MSSTTALILTQQAQVRVCRTFVVQVHKMCVESKRPHFFVPAFMRLMKMMAFYLSLFVNTYLSVHPHTT